MACGGRGGAGDFFFNFLACAAECRVGRQMWDWLSPSEGGFCASSRGVQGTSAESDMGAGGGGRPLGLRSNGVG